MTSRHGGWLWTLPIGALHKIVLGAGRGAVFRQGRRDEEATLGQGAAGEWQCFRQAQRKTARKRR